MTTITLNARPQLEIETDGLRGDTLRYEITLKQLTGETITDLSADWRAALSSPDLELNGQVRERADGALLGNFLLSVDASTDILTAFVPEDVAAQMSNQAVGDIQTRFPAKGFAGQFETVTIAKLRFCNELDITTGGI